VPLGEGPRWVSDPPMAGPDRTLSSNPIVLLRWTNFVHPSNTIELGLWLGLGLALGLGLGLGLGLANSIAGVDIF
jgi:hypothetical protein